MVNRILDEPSLADFREQYHLLNQIITQCAPCDLQNTTIDYLASNAKDLRRLQSYLGENGFDQFKIAGAGRYSLILEPIANREKPIVIRISLAEQLSTAAIDVVHPAILLSYAETELLLNKKIRIEVKPKLNTHRVSEEDERIVEAALAEGGISAKDVVNCDNVGYMEIRGKKLPLLMDAGVVQTIIPSGNGQNIGFYKDTDDRWLQTVYDPRLNPERLKKNKHLSIRDQLSRSQTIV